MNVTAQIQDQPAAAGGQVCVVADRWPRFSSTFVAQELVGLEKEGLVLSLATFGKPDKVNHAIIRELQAPINRLPTTPWKSLRYWKAWAKVRKWPGYEVGKALLKADLVHGKKRKRLKKYFGRAVILAAELPADTRVIYAHFLNLTTTIARYTAAIAGLPLTASGHARDIWTAPEHELRAKLEQLEWCATCTTSGAERLKELADSPDKIHLVHHGLSFERFPTDAPERSRRDGSDRKDPVRLLSVGRAVEKKGFDVLLEALAELPRDLHWHWHHVGAGALSDSLKKRGEELGLSSRITWHGAQDQPSVVERYRDCDLFVLPSREAGDGDRDGLPNVLMEAQSQGLACLSTEFSAIPELIINGKTGMMVPPGDRAALGEALSRLIRTPEERLRLGEAGYKRVRGEFEAEKGIRHIARLLRRSMA